MASPNGPLGISRPALTARRFSDPDRAERLLGDPALAGLSPTELDAVVTELVGAAGPDSALLCLVRLAESAPDRATFLSVLGADAAFRHRLIAVLGASPALGEHLVTHPRDWELLRTGRFDTSVPTADEFAAMLLAAVGAKTGSADGSVAEPVAADATPQTVEALRTAYRRVLLTLAACDLTGRVDVESIAAGLADLAAATLRAALAVARAGRGATGVPCRLAVIAMGKCGGRELNYVSDVDVIFVAEPAEPAGSRPARRACCRCRCRAAVGDRARQRDDDDLRRRRLAGRRRPAPGGQERPAGAHARLLRELLPAVGAHLGVPGSAQGSPGRR